MDLTGLYERLGTIGAKLDGLDEKVDDLRETTNQRHLENQGRFVELEKNASASVADRTEIKRTLKDTADRVGKIEKPVNDFVALRNKVGAWITIVSVGGFFLWFFISPFWGVIERKVIYWLFPGLRPNP
jgi:hypothetical protein